jgi:hypothetical protein
MIPPVVDDTLCVVQSAEWMQFFIIKIAGLLGFV